MLTQNFYSQLMGGGNSTDLRKMYVINTDKTRVSITTGFICRLTALGSNSLTVPSSGANVSSYCMLVAGNTSDTGFTLPDTVYSEKDLIKYGLNTNAFPIIDKTTSVAQRTGIKLTDTVQNTGSQDITINYVALLDRSDSSVRHILALKMLDAPVTIKPTETFVIEYTLDNLYPVTPDNV